jgi:hypothetical protein
MVLQVPVPDMINVLGLHVILHLKVDVGAMPNEDAFDNLVLLPLETDRETLRQVLKVGVVRRSRHFEVGNMD